MERQKHWPKCSFAPLCRFIVELHEQDFIEKEECCYSVL